MCIWNRSAFLSSTEKQTNKTRWILRENILPQNAFCSLTLTFAVSVGCPPLISSSVRPFDLRKAWSFYAALLFPRLDRRLRCGLKASTTTVRPSVRGGGSVVSRLSLRGTISSVRRFGRSDFLPLKKIFMYPSRAMAVESRVDMWGKEEGVFGASTLRRY